MQTLPAANAIRMLCAECAVQVWSWGMGIQQDECGNGCDLSWSVLLTAFYLVPRHKTSRPQTKTRTIELLATSNRHLPLFVTLSSLTERVHDTRVMQCNVDHDKLGHCLRTDRGHFVKRTPSYTRQNMGNWRSSYIIIRGHKVGFT